jgi:hypothetical protein
MSERVKMGLEVVKATHTYYGSSLSLPFPN